MTESDWALEGKRALSVVVLASQAWVLLQRGRSGAGKGMCPGAAEGHAWSLPLG